MVTKKGVLRVNCLDLGDELAERLLVEFQDTPKVTHSGLRKRTIRGPRMVMTTQLFNSLKSL